MEIARQRQTYAAYEFSPLLSDCRGFLLKLDGLSKTWKRRYCILVDSFLILYTEFDATSAIGIDSFLHTQRTQRLDLPFLYFCFTATLCLHGYRVQSTGGLTGSKRHAFELIPPNPESKNFYFVAETETEKKR